MYIYICINVYIYIYIHKHRGTRWVGNGDAVGGQWGRGGWAMGTRWVDNVAWTKFLHYQALRPYAWNDPRGEN